MPSQQQAPQMSRTTDERAAAPALQRSAPAEQLPSHAPAPLPDYEAMVPVDVIDIIDLFIKGADILECAVKIDRTPHWLRKELAKEPARMLIAQRERELTQQRARLSLAKLVAIAGQTGSLAAAESAARFLAETGGMGARSAAAKKGNSAGARSVTVKLIRSGDRSVNKSTTEMVGNSIEVRVDDAQDDGIDDPGMDDAIEPYYEDIGARDEASAGDGLD